MAARARNTPTTTEHAQRCHERVAITYRVSEVAAPVAGGAHQHMRHATTARPISQGHEWHRMRRSLPHTHGRCLHRHVHLRTPPAVSNLRAQFAVVQFGLRQGDSTEHNRHQPRRLRADLQTRIPSDVASMSTHPPLRDSTCACQLTCGGRVCDGSMVRALSMILRANPAQCLQLQRAVALQIVWQSEQPRHRGSVRPGDFARLRAVRVRESLSLTETGGCAQR